ncbi:hypothetical protein LTR17_001636 [Elasticomyces elasticus]|nr:hypothetical protein LTR17_001636 [Elasticomyces elasticus]
MVQYRTHRWGYSPLSEAREWWKLDGRENLSGVEAREILDKRGFTHNKSLTKSRKAELRRLYQTEGLVLPHVNTASKAVLVALLESYDPVFPKFMDLPPELRVLVYEHYLADFEPVGMFVPPPITAVSQNIRNEALPVFFDNHRFLFDDENFDGFGSPRYGDFNWRVGREVPDATFSQIRKLRIKGRLTVWDAVFECDIYMGGRTKQPRVEDCRVIGELAKYEVIHQVAVIVGGRVQDVLDAMAARPEGKAFQRTDIDDLMAVLLAKPKQNLAWRESWRFIPA